MRTKYFNIGYKEILNSLSLTYLPQVEMSANIFLSVPVDLGHIWADCMYSYSITSI